ncbi:Probable adenine permease PurP [Aedoeadaptatus ivorii]|uniref:Probable adenine permease PurP n=1 Tax=Aedoeadaptatus ivorii TaxID=54006 RepID=A0A3S5BWH4_9FIRM|nr:NCS2 family permease [Peptoniphilus ivorii]MDQ0508803.1 AGZA family xanthine/uracil permease-like MFS transporter [Peptoniphilus ivorii]VEJ36077.1 Probable adenine permease PurP [Peptoniphilus ivorii]
MESFFKLRENGTDLSTEILAGFTTFFAMSYIIFVNPAILSQTGIPWGAVFLATIIAAVVATLVMGLFANVPYALAPGMGLNAFFTYTVVFGLGFSWQEALGMVFLCGVINVLITVTKIRKLIITSIPEFLQHAISGGIGVFIAYIGVKNAGFLNFTLDPGTYQTVGETVIGSSAAVPALVNFSDPGVLLAVLGLIITVVLVVRGVKGAILISILATTVLGIPFGVVDLSKLANGVSVSQSFGELSTVFTVALGREGLLGLFADPARIPLVLMTIFAFSLSDTFDTLGTFIGTGRRSGIFSEEDIRNMQNSSGFKSKLDKALFADSVGTVIGAFVGTSNTTTYVESAAGIGAGGRTGLTSLVVAILFLLSIFIAPVAGLVPAQATAPVLIVVGIMMCASFQEIEWTNLDVAIPAFFASIFMGLSYSISNGIAAGFIFYCVVSLVKGRTERLHPILVGSSVLFLINYGLMAYLSM